MWIWFSKHPVLNDSSGQCGTEFLMEARSSPDAFIHYFSAQRLSTWGSFRGRKEIEDSNQPDVLERRELTSARNERIQGLASLTAGSAKYPRSSLFPRSALFAEFNDYLRCKVSERLWDLPRQLLVCQHSVPSRACCFRLRAVKWELGFTRILTITCLRMGSTGAGE